MEVILDGNGMLDQLGPGTSEHGIKRDSFFQ